MPGSEAERNGRLRGDGESRHMTAGAFAARTELDFSWLLVAMRREVQASAVPIPSSWRSYSLLAHYLLSVADRKSGESSLKPSAPEEQGDNSNSEHQPDSEHQPHSELIVMNHEPNMSQQCRAATEKTKTAGDQYAYYCLLLGAHYPPSDDYSVLAHYSVATGRHIGQTTFPH